MTDTDNIFNMDAFEKDDLVVEISYFKLEHKDLEGGYRSYFLSI